MNGDVRRKALEMIQAWATAFRGMPDLTYVNDVYNLLRSEGRSHERAHACS